MATIRGTTPDYLLTIKGYDLTDKTVYVTMQQGKHLVTLTGDRLNITVSGQDSEIAITLTQSDTLDFQEGNASVQVKMIDAQGHVDATEIGRLVFTKALLEKVIAYDNDTA